MWAQKFREVLAMILAAAVPCATIWYSFWVAVGLSLSLAIGYVVNLISEKRALAQNAG